MNKEQIRLKLFSLTTSKNNKKTLEVLNKLSLHYKLKGVIPNYINLLNQCLFMYYLYQKGSIDKLTLNKYIQESVQLFNK